MVPLLVSWERQTQVESTFRVGGLVPMNWPIALGGCWMMGPYGLETAYRFRDGWLFSRDSHTRHESFHCTVGGWFS